MNQSLLHLIEIAKIHKNQFDEQYFEDMMASCRLNAQNDRYLILFLIKIWQNNQEFLGHRFKQWVQQLKDCNSKQALDLLRNGQVHECISKFEQNLSRNAFEAIKKHNFFPKSDSMQQEESFRRVKENLKQYDDATLNKINKILSGDVESILELSKSDWISFVMLYVQFCDYRIKPLDMTKILKQLKFSIEEENNNLMQLFGEIVLTSQNVYIINCLLKYDLHLTYFLYLYFESKEKDKLRSEYEIQKSKFQLIKTILKDIPNEMTFENEILYFFEEITNVITDAEFEQEFLDIYNSKLKGIILSTNNFRKIMNFVQNIEKFSYGNSASLVLEVVLQKIFNAQQQPLEEKKNALNIIFERFNYTESFIQIIKQVINNHINNPYFDDIFKDFLNNFYFQNYNQYFQQELIQLQFKFGLKLYDLPQTQNFEYPELLIMNISQEFIRNVVKSDDAFKLRMKIILSSLLEQCQNTQDEKLNNRKNIIRLLIRRL
ncbi:unnamed protein product (macronuclear) [Paramecium tetraurelia]|uniref:Uncharacterized protein n=1 Tax=Paramecium tetraurelia TaxID=5888 RepID=A0E8I5_PARTE|nr:uncharacterized protein GSPATT00024331001 [Paramecium tetraurelia]CAK91602.1 unnamed protein product [Paramecium tetraurelia]|eukprot:XP_001458999.1 hypothetical protein (macronuclear) [Paramecium tetraurelia strain d4-2]